MPWCITYGGLDMMLCSISRRWYVLCFRTSALSYIPKWVVGMPQLTISLIGNSESCLQFWWVSLSSSGWPCVLNAQQWQTQTRHWDSWDYAPWGGSWIACKCALFSSLAQHSWWARDAHMAENAYGFSFASKVLETWMKIKWTQLGTHSSIKHASWQQNTAVQQIAAGAANPGLELLEFACLNVDIFNWPKKNSVIDWQSMTRSWG